MVCKYTCGQRMCYILTLIIFEWKVPAFLLGISKFNHMFILVLTLVDISIRVTWEIGVKWLSNVVHLVKFPGCKSFSRFLIEAVVTNRWCTICCFAFTYEEFNSHTHELILWITSMVSGFLSVESIFYFFKKKWYNHYCHLCKLSSFLEKYQCDF